MESSEIGVITGQNEASKAENSSGGYPPFHRTAREWEKFCMADWTSAKGNDIRHFGPY